MRHKFKAVWNEWLSDLNTQCKRSSGCSRKLFKCFKQEPKMLKTVWQEDESGTSVWCELAADSSCPQIAPGAACQAHYSPQLRVEYFTRVIPRDLDIDDRTIYWFWLKKIPYFLQMLFLSDGNLCHRIIAPSFREGRKGLSHFFIFR